MNDEKIFHEETEIISSHPAPYHFDRKQMLRNSIYIGLTVALSMATFFAVAKIFVSEISPLIHYMQYVLIFGLVNMFLISQKHNTGYKESFVDKNFTSGAVSSVLAAVFFFILEAGIYEVLPGATVYQQTGPQQTVGTTPIAVFALMAVETFVFGMLSTFIAFQYLKRPVQVTKEE